MVSILGPQSTTHTQRPHPVTGMLLYCCVRERRRPVPICIVALILRGHTLLPVSLHTALIHGLGPVFAYVLTHSCLDKGQTVVDS
jgi:hypothetical protein